MKSFRETKEKNSKKLNLSKIFFLVGYISSQLIHEPDKVLQIPNRAAENNDGKCEFGKLIIYLIFSFHFKIILI